MANVKKYLAEVVSFKNHFENVYSAEFRSLSGKYRYLPGQFLHLALDEYDPSCGWPESRCFSIQSSPADENIMITFSVKGKFTATMANELNLGKIVNLKLPYGELFQQEHSKERTVFIAGGTGVTPFLSLFSDPVFSEYKNPKLYFGLREEKLNIYEKFLENAIKMNPGLKIIIRYQDQNGIFQINDIQIENGPGSSYFISGPQIMISAFKSGLLSAGVPESNIKSDDWQ